MQFFKVIALNLLMLLHWKIEHFINKAMFFACYISIAQIWMYRLIIRLATSLIDNSLIFFCKKIENVLALCDSKSTFVD